jgi:glucose/arabinose dehydrogenase
MSYSSKDNYIQNHNQNNFKEPIFSFVPSIGISEIIKLPNSFNKSWQDNFIIASLNKHSLFRIKFDNKYSKIIYFEEIYIGQRIRDIKFYKNNILLALEGKGELGILSNHE